MTRQQEPNELSTLTYLHIILFEMLVCTGITHKHIREVDDKVRTHEMHKNMWILETSGAEQCLPIEFDGLSCHHSLFEFY
jgi:hypothetical protein